MTTFVSHLFGITLRGASSVTAYLQKHKQSNVRIFCTDFDLTWMHRSFLWTSRGTCHAYDVKVIERVLLFAVSMLFERHGHRLATFYWLSMVRSKSFRQREREKWVDPCSMRWKDPVDTLMKTSFLSWILLRLSERRTMLMFIVEWIENSYIEAFMELAHVARSWHVCARNSLASKSLLDERARKNSADSFDRIHWVPTAVSTRMTPAGHRHRCPDCLRWIRTQRLVGAKENCSGHRRSSRLDERWPTEVG